MSVSATRSSTAKTSRMAGLLPSMAPKWSRPESGTVDLVGEEGDRGLAEQHRHARLDPRLFDADAVDEAAVGAAEVAQEHAAGADHGARRAGR
jgi:hypothetical protein